MLCRLAFQNAWRSRRDYLVYLLTLAVGVAVFYAFNTVSVQVDIAGVEASEQGLGELLGSLLLGLTLFLAAVMGFLLVYANNFIMRRRKREFGLLQLMGLGTGQLAAVIALETLIVTMAALALGLALGVGLSQLMVFFTASLFKTQIASFHFFFSTSALAITLGCVTAIFTLSLAMNLRAVARSRISELLSARRVGERRRIRRAWVAALVFVLGAALVAWAYARLLTDGLPLDGGAEAMCRFGVTTLIVVVGTVLVFFGLSGFLLKAVQGVRGLYWRGLAPFTTRQLASKLSSVSASLAVVAMVLFLAITSVTCGMSIATMMNEGLEQYTPVDWSVTLDYYDSDELAAAATAGYEVSGTGATEPVDLLAATARERIVAEDGASEPFDVASIATSSFQLDVWSSTPRGQSVPLVSLGELLAATGQETPKGVAGSNVETQGLGLVAESSYNALLAFLGKEPVSLGESGYIITCDMGETISDLYSEAMAQGYGIELAGRTLTPAASAVDAGASTFCNSVMTGSNSGTVVVPDEVLAALDVPPSMSFLLANYAGGITREEADGYLAQEREYEPPTNSEGLAVGVWGMECTRTEAYESANSMNGLISYLAVYIGFVLVVASAAILAIQQLSGVVDASSDVRVLAELGCETREIGRSLLVQQGVFFAFPLVVGVCHSLVALRVIIDLVRLFGGISIAGMAGLTCAIFLLCYGGYFVLTARLSARMIREYARARHTG